MYGRNSSLIYVRGNDTNTIIIICEERVRQRDPLGPSLLAADLVCYVEECTAGLHNTKFWSFGDSEGNR